MSYSTHTVIVERKGFWLFRRWEIWDTRDPVYVLDAPTRKEAADIARSFAGDDGDILERVDGSLTRVAA